MAEEKVVPLRRPPEPGPTDKEISEQFVDRMAPGWRYVAAWSVWMLFDDEVWVDDEVEAVDHEAQQFLAELAEPMKGKKREKLLSASKYSAIARMSRSHPAISARVDQWDGDHETLSCEGAIIFNMEETRNANDES